MWSRGLFTFYILLIVSISFAHGQCYHSNVIGSDGYGHDVILYRNGNKTMVVFGEVVRYTYQPIIFYNGTMMKTGSKLSSIVNSYYLLNGTSGLISSAYSGTTYYYNPVQYVALLPRMSYLNPNYSITADILALKISNPVSDNVCENVIDYLNVGRYDIYNNYRYARYSLIILTSLVLIVIIYYSYPSRVVNERLFRSTVVLFLAIAFGIIGIVSMNTSMGFQGIEYSYYIGISIVYFGGFIRYVLHKLLQERTTRFYTNLKTYSNNQGLEGLKTGSRMLTSIENNNALNKFVALIPRSYTDMVLLLLVGILWIPSIMIITYDSLGTVPYSNFMLSVTIVEFAVPICSTFIPALTTFLWSIYDYIVKGKIKRLGHYFTIAEDPLLYRIEFLGCLMLPLPFSIITFIIGNTDGAIPSYILTARWYHLTFHALFYIAFDLSYLILLSGAVSILGMKMYERGINISDVGSITTGTAHRLRITKKEKIGLAMLKDKAYYDVVKDYCIKTGSYAPLGVAEWLDGITDGRMLKVVKDSYTEGPIGECIMKILMDAGIVTDDDLVLSNNIGNIIKSIIASMHHLVIKSVLTDGFDQTYDYQEFLTNSSTTLKEDVDNVEMKEKLKKAIENDAVSINSMSDETLSINSITSQEPVECNKMVWIQEDPEPVV